MTRDRCDIYKQHKAVDAAYRSGDMDALVEALDHPDGFPNCLQPFELAVGDYPLEYAIYWSPLAFIEELISMGADVNYPDQAGFPSLIATLTSGRPDLHDILKLLINHGADVNQRGTNDWTPLHCAVNQRDETSIRILLDNGANPSLRTRIDDYTTPLDEAK